MKKRQIILLTVVTTLFTMFCSYIFINATLNPAVGTHTPFSINADSGLSIPAYKTFSITGTYNNVGIIFSDSAKTIQFSGGGGYNSKLFVCPTDQAAGDSGLTTGDLYIWVYSVTGTRAIAQKI